MALRPTTIRFPKRSHDVIQEEADNCGIPMAQYVREAALIRAVLDRADRLDKGGVSMPALVREVRELSRDNESMDRRAGD